MSFFVFAALVVPVAATADSPPPGSTAKCRDGTYSRSQHHSGTCSHHGGVAVWLDGSGATTTPAAPSGVGASVALGSRSRSSACSLGVEPDRRCSPGAYYSGLTEAVICSSTFTTSTIRDVPQSEKYAVEREYGLRAALYGHTLEIDHIVPLELGGSNDIANLFPERAYHAKDRLENRLHELVCAGTMTLEAARSGIAADWVGLYRHVFGAAPTG